MMCAMCGKEGRLILALVEGTELKLCSDCSEYADCDTLESFYRGGDYESARQTLARIKEVGLDTWVKEREAEQESV